MSYKNTVLNDFPNSFYLLDEVEKRGVTVFRPAEITTFERKTRCE